jgi:hypothetical protein
MQYRHTWLCRHLLLYGDNVVVGVLVAFSTQNAWVTVRLWQNRPLNLAGTDPLRYSMPDAE